MYSIGFAGLLVLIVLGLALVAYAALIGSLLWHKRWGLASLGIGLPCAALLIAATMALLSYASMEQIRAETDARRIATGSRPMASTPEVVSDAEFQAITAAAPQIDLGDEPAGAESEIDLRGLDLLEAAEDLPEWAREDRATEPGERLLVSGPFGVAESCRRHTEELIGSWLADRVRERGWGEAGADLLPTALAARGDSLQESFVENQLLQEIESSVGDVYVQHTLVRLTPADEAWIDDAIGGVVSRRRAVRVATGGGLLIAVVGVAHLVLRQGPAGEREE